MGVVATGVVATAPKQQSHQALIIDQKFLKVLVVAQGLTDKVWLQETQAAELY